MIEKKIYIKLILFFTILFFYFFGFYVKEISNGAAHTDLQLHIWIIISDFKSNFLYSFTNYIEYKEGTMPFFHIFQSFVNPFTDNVAEYTLSNTIFNLLIPLIVYFILKNKIETNLAFYISLILLISPWFRSTSYWGTTENFALFFVVPSLFFFEKVINQKENYIQNNILLIIFLSCSIYARQQYFFLVIAHVLIIFYNKYDFKRTILFFLVYLVLSLPGFLTLFIWNAHENIQVSTSNSEFISIKNIFNNVIIISNLLLYYSIPLIFLNLKKTLKIINIKNITYFIIIFVIMLILFRNFEFPVLGGGFILKFSKLVLKENIYFLIFTSSLFLSFLIFIYDKKYIRYYIILFSLYLWFGLIGFIYQEWFDPFYILFLFIAISKQTLINNNFNSKHAVVTLYGWEIITLFSAIYYYHFYLKIPFMYNF